jgi:hypothetical protein
MTPGPYRSRIPDPQTVLSARGRAVINETTSFERAEAEHAAVKELMAGIYESPPTDRYFSPIAGSRKPHDGGPGAGSNFRCDIAWSIWIIAFGTALVCCGATATRAPSAGFATVRGWEHCRNQSPRGRCRRASQAALARLERAGEAR